MSLRPICHRICRRLLIFGGVGAGVLVATTASCDEQVASIMLTNAESFVISLVEMWFDQLEAEWLGGGDTIQAGLRLLGPLLA